MSSATKSAQSLIVRQDIAVRKSVLRIVKDSQALAPLNLLGRRSPQRMLDYLERRSRKRSPVELPIYVTPANFDGTMAERLTSEDESMLCHTKDVSLRGLGFTHDEPLEAHWVIVSFDLWDADITLLLEVRWQNVEVNRYLWMSGGRFVGVIPNLD